MVFNATFNNTSVIYRGVVYLRIRVMVFNATFNNTSVIYRGVVYLRIRVMVFNDTFNNVSYSVEHGDQFYWCLTTIIQFPRKLFGGTFGFLYGNLSTTLYFSLFLLICNN